MTLNQTEMGPVGDDDPFCDCTDMSKRELLSTIVTRKLRTVRDIRRETGVGRSCGSCRHDLHEILDEAWRHA